MRFLILAPTDQIDRASTFALELAGEVRGAGHEALIVGVAKGLVAPAVTPLGQATDAKGIALRLMQQRYAFDPGLLGQMEVLFSRFQPHVFVSQDLAGLAIYRLARWRPRLWLPLFDRSTSAAGREARGLGSHALRIFLRKLERTALKKADAVLAPGGGEAEALARMGVKPDRVVKLGEGDRHEGWTKEVLAAAEKLAREKGLPR